jgi:hypothetical protein
MSIGIYIVGLLLVLFFLGTISIAIDILTEEDIKKPRWIVSDGDYPAREE